MENPFLPLIKATGIISLSALLLSTILALSGRTVEAKISLGVSLGATITALMATSLND